MAVKSKVGRILFIYRKKSTKKDKENKTKQRKTMYSEPKLRADVDGLIWLLPTLICKSLNCCFKNEDVKTMNSVLESLILSLCLIIQVLKSEIHRLILSNAIVRSDKSNVMYNCVASAYI